MLKNLADFVVTRLLDIISDQSLELLTAFTTTLECDPQNAIKFLPRVFSIYLNLLVRSDDETRTTIFGYLEIVVTKSRVEFMQFMPIVCQSISTLECLQFACVLFYELYSQFSEHAPVLYFTVCNYLKSRQLTGPVRHFRRLLKFASFAILNRGQTIEPFPAALDKCEIDREIGHFVLKRLILLVQNVDVRLFIFRLPRTAVRLVSLGVVTAQSFLLHFMNIRR
jgi:hypothetical protein